MAIIRHGYADPTRLRREVYNKREWKRVREVVLARDGRRCRFCGEPAKPGERLDVAHMGNTARMLDRGENVFDPSACVTAHRRCHSAYASGKIPGLLRPPG